MNPTAKTILPKSMTLTVSRLHVTHDRWAAFSARAPHVLVEILSCALGAHEDSTAMEDLSDAQANFEVAATGTLRMLAPEAKATDY